MSRSDRSQYAEAVTRLSRDELQDVLSVAEPPVCLLGGWAVHLHVTEGFRDAHGREYIGSRDIDLGVHIDSAWSTEELTSAPVSTTLHRIEDEVGYRRGRFGFHQQFHRETGEPLDDATVRDLPAHDIFRVDVDIIPDTTSLDEFQDAFGFRPPAEPLLQLVFEEGEHDHLDDYVDWTVPAGVRIAPAAVLAAMKVRAFPDRDKSHKQLKDLADLHSLLWYVTEYDSIQPVVLDHLIDDDLTAFQSAVTDDLYERAASLIQADATVVRQSVERLLV